MAGAHRELHHNGQRLETHVSHIQRLVAKGLHDAESRRLAVKLVSGRFETRTMQNGESLRVVEAWGKYFIAPPGRVCKQQDDECEIERVWDFLVSNVRYVADTVSIDVFATLKETLISGGGDCDDASIAFATLLGTLGFTVVGRVVSLQDAPDDWAHIFPIVGVPKETPTKWIALDMTVPGAMPGWVYPHIAKFEDFVLTAP